jgi:hypothetical protein
MESISESIHTDVPARFAGRAWDEFVFGSRARGRPRSLADTRWWVDESPVESGVVKFARGADGQVTVTVELAYEPGGGPDEGRRVRERLRHDLESYRRFIDQRCRDTDCRNEMRRAA